MACPGDVVIIDRGYGCRVKVHLFGATIISWECNGEEMLFVSSQSKFDNKKAIRGGIPVVFPNFGPWDLGPQHGFARISQWTLSEAPKKDSNGDVTACFTLEDTEETRKMWNHKFILKYTVQLTASTLQTSFSVKNTGSDAFSFTCLLHTYIRTPDVTKVTISGLKGLSYVDKVDGGKQSVEDRDLVTISENVDRVYSSTPNKHTVTHAAGGYTVAVQKENFPDTVVWNPWEKAAGMSDFGNDEYPLMVCVEAGGVSAPTQLAPGAEYNASQTLTAAKL